MKYQIIFLFFQQPIPGGSDSRLCDTDGMFSLRNHKFIRIRNRNDTLFLSQRSKRYITYLRVFSEKFRKFSAALNTDWFAGIDIPQLISAVPVRCKQHPFPVL